MQEIRSAPKFLHGFGAQRDINYVFTACITHESRAKYRKRKGKQAPGKYY
jgi:hypothetical protein